MTKVFEPKQSWAITSKPGAVQNTPQKVLLVGIRQQSTQAGTISGQLVENVQGDVEELTELFGSRSMLTDMVKQFRKINKVTQIDCISFAKSDMPTAVDSILEFEISGNATSDGIIQLSVGSEIGLSRTINIVNGTSEADIATAIREAYQTPEVPFVVSSGGTPTLVTFTPREDFLPGAFGNGFGAKITKNTVSGLTISLYTGATAGAGVVTSSLVTDAFNKISSQRYQTIVFTRGLHTETTAEPMKTILNDRYFASNRILDGMGITVQSNAVGTVSPATGALGNAAAFNSRAMNLINNTIYPIPSDKGSGAMIIEFDHVIAAQIAAYRALRYTPNEDISRFLVGSSITNSFGGPSRAAEPYFNTPFENLPLSDRKVNVSAVDLELMENNGVSYLGNNPTDTALIMGPQVTTYTSDAAGNPDPTFKYVNAVDTSSIIREYFYDNCRREFAQNSLTLGDLVPGSRMANEGRIRSFIEKLYNDLSGVGYGLTVAGAEALRFFKQNLNVVVNEVTSTATVTCIVPIVGQLRTLDGTIEISFDLSTTN